MKMTAPLGTIKALASLALLLFNGAVIGLGFAILFTSTVNAQGNSIDNGAIVSRSDGNITFFNGRAGPLSVRYEYVGGPGDLTVAPPGRDLRWFSITGGAEHDHYGEV